MKAAEENINEKRARDRFSTRTDKTDQSVKPSLFRAERIIIGIGHKLWRLDRVLDSSTVVSFQGNNSVF